MPTTSPLFISEGNKIPPRWVVERYSDDDPTLIRFVKWGRTGKQLDQVARWVGGRWDPARWVPRAPQCPQYMLNAVTRRLRTEVGR
ncbi:MAG: hypothetical protein VKM34_10755 [Cyanobacteriota bacterium]|nr:hypothetical protein [Cyanobacteriota bacterium]